MAKHLLEFSGEKPLLRAELENKFVDYAAKGAIFGIGFGKQQFLEYAVQLAKKHKVHFKWSKLSKKWWQLMKRRNSNTHLWKTKGTAAIRHMCMDRVKVSNVTVPSSKLMSLFQNSSSPLDKDSDVLLYPKPQLRLKKQEFAEGKC